MEAEESEFGLDREDGIVVKIGNTLSLFLVATFFLMFTAVAFFVDGPLWVLLPFQLVIEICWTFWMLALLRVWFRWQWLHNLFMRSEKRFMLVVRLAIYMLPFFTIGTLVLVWYLTQIGILPVRPK